MFAHAVAQAGKPVVAVTVDFVKVAQKAEAVAAWAVMNEAHYSHSQRQLFAISNANYETFEIMKGVPGLGA